MVTEASLTTAIESIFDSGKTYQIALLEYSAEQVSFVAGNVNTTSNEITLAGASFVIGTRVKISGLSDFNSAQTYFSLSASSPYQFSETLGGSAVDISAAAGGTVTDEEPRNDALSPVSGRKCQNMNDLVRYEVSDYQGQALRPTWTPSGSNIVNSQALIPGSTNTVDVTNTNDDDTLSFQYIGIIEAGSTTPASTTGILRDVIKYNSVQSLARNQTRRITVNAVARAANG